MRIAICVPPAPGDSYGQHLQYAQQLAATAQRRGIRFEILKYPDERFFSRLFDCLADAECLVYFHTFFFDLRLHTSLATQTVHAVEGCRAKTLATIGDHPVTHFMQERIFGAHPRTRFIVIDPTFVEEMWMMNPLLQDSEFVHVPIFPAEDIDPSALVDFRGRGTDVLIPMKVIDPTGGDIARLIENIRDPAIAKIAGATYEHTIRETGRNPFSVFAELLKSEQQSPLEETRAKDPAMFRGLLQIITLTDDVIRQARRNRMMSTLLRDIGDLRVTVTSPSMDWLKIDKRVQFVGEVRIADVTTRMMDARAVVNCSPTYPNSLHERIKDPMSLGCASITDVNTFLRANFSTEHFVPYDYDSTMSLVEVFEAYDLEKIALAGRGRVRGDAAFSWDVHLDGILEFVSG